MTMKLAIIATRSTPWTWSTKCSACKFVAWFVHFASICWFRFPFSRFVASIKFPRCIPQIIAILPPVKLRFFSVFQPWSEVCVPSSAVDMCIQSWSRQYLLFCRLARLAILLACDSWLSLILRQIVAKLESNANFGIWYDAQQFGMTPWWRGCSLISPSPMCSARRTRLSFFCYFNYNYQRFVDLSDAAYRIDRFEAPFLMQLNVALGPKTRPLFLSVEQLNSS